MSSFVSLLPKHSADVEFQPRSADTLAQLASPLGTSLRNERRFIVSSPSLSLAIVCTILEGALRLFAPILIKNFYHSLAPVAQVPLVKFNI
jgi:hypothetical protein